MEKSLNITMYEKEHYKNILEELKNQDLSSNTPEEIGKIIMEKMGGTLFYVTTQKVEQKFKLYRIRTDDGSIKNINKISEFSYNPNPSTGRLNPEGVPVFYSAFEIKTCLSEMKEKVMVYPHYISEWELTIPKGTVIGMLFMNGNPTLETTTGALISGFRDKIYAQKNLSRKECDIMIGQAEAMCDILTIENEDYYNITSALGFTYLYKMKEQRADVPILFYPSVTQDLSDINVAIHPSFVDGDNLELKSIVHCSVRDYNFDRTSVSAYKKGIPKVNKINWLFPKPKVNGLDYENVLVSFNNGARRRYNACHILARTGNYKTSFCDYLKDWVNSQILQKELFNYNFKGDFFSSTSLEQEQIFHVVPEKEVYLDSSPSPVRSVGIKIKFVHEFR